MSKSLKIALAIQVLIMVSVLVPPLLTKATGTKVYLETERVDPRSLFRGDYVIVNYPIRSNIPESLASEAHEKGELIYVTITTDRPAQYIDASTSKPALEPNQACITARPNERFGWIDGDNARFPQISQFFVPEGTGRDIEKDLNSMVATIVTTKSCNAVLVDLDYL